MADWSVVLLVATMVDLTVARLGVTMVDWWVVLWVVLMVDLTDAQLVVTMVGLSADRMAD